MRTVIALAVVAVGCQKDAPELIVEPLPPSDAAPGYSPDPPKPPAKQLGRIARLSVHDWDTVCLHDTAGVAKCMKMFLRSPFVALVPEIVAVAQTFTLAGAKCSLAGGTLACAGATPIRDVALAWSEPYGYLGTRGRLWYHDVSGDAPELRELTFAGGIAQVSIGYRVGCVLAGDGAVWCWSDPTRPRRMTTPPKVASIMIQDPFELCMHTEAGELHCTPPFVQKDTLVCSSRTLECGTGGPEDPVIRKAFDPLTPLARPLRKVAMPHAVRALARDEDRLYVFALDSYVVAPEPIGGCTIGGATGSVTCFAACGTRWVTTRVDGIAQPVTQVSPDDTHGYAIAADGTLWSWPRERETDKDGVPGCPKPVATATSIPQVGKVAQLAEPLYVQNGPQDTELHRCALAVDGKVTCWRLALRASRIEAFYDPEKGAPARSP